MSFSARRTALPTLLLLGLLVAMQACAAQPADPVAAVAPYPNPRPVLKEINPPKAPPADQAVVIVGATLIDGRGGEPIVDSAVVVQGEKITAVGPRAKVTIPAGAEIVDARGLTLLPGLIDSHFHIENDVALPRLYLSHGITTVRDPGEWLKRWTPAINIDSPMPRYFHCGPHLERKPPKHPGSSYIVNDIPEAVAAVNRWIDEGASAIKVYNRLTLAQIHAVAVAAHARGVPVICHLEIIRADDAIKAGADGIEHTDSIGPSFNDPVKAAAFAAEAEAGADYQTLTRSPNKGRWSKYDMDAPRVKEVIDTFVKYHATVGATLAVYEPPVGEEYGVFFKDIMKLTGMLYKAGVNVVVGSHTSVPRAQRGAAYLREMQLLHDCGMPNMAVIQAATINNARYLHSEARIGSVEAGKLADLLIIEGDPLKDISVIAQVRKVMLNGQWVAAEPYQLGRNERVPACAGHAARHRPLNAVECRIPD